MYNGKTTDRLEVGFPSSNRPKPSENTMQVAIKEKSDFNLSKLGLFRKNIFLNN